ncbi:MAG: hypothetical protein PHV34_22320 [Verrucomicrobiae bacterium]|nr:hypothetical protein [Verrucomicrobiae bacterium]
MSARLWLAYWKRTLELQLGTPGVQDALREIQDLWRASFRSLSAHCER